MNVLLVCERSGGHIFPALVVGEKLKAKSQFFLFNGRHPKEIKEIYFFVTSRRLKSYITKEGFKVFGKTFPFRNLIFEGLWRFIEAVCIILELRPKVIIGFGGRDSFFLLLLGSICFIDTAIYEPNIKFGKANKILSFFVRWILCGFEKDKFDERYIPSKTINLFFQEKKIKTIGIPLRKNIRKINKETARKNLNFENIPTIFCFGGSQGSTFINKIMVEFVQNVDGRYQIIHLTGERQYREILYLYKRINKKIFVNSFYYSMEILYNAADLVICRSGASTLAEIAYYELPAILIPHPKGGGHQRDNAFYFKEMKASVVFEENYFKFQEFKNSVQTLLYDDSVCRRMKDNLRKIRLGVSYNDFLENKVPV